MVNSSSLTLFRLNNRMVVYVCYRKECKYRSLNTQGLWQKCKSRQVGETHLLQLDQGVRDKEGTPFSQMIHKPLNYMISLINRSTAGSWYTLLPNLVMFVPAEALCWKSGDYKTWLDIACFSGRHDFWWLFSGKQLNKMTIIQKCDDLLFFGIHVNTRHVIGY